MIRRGRGRGLGLDGNAPAAFNGPHAFDRDSASAKLAPLTDPEHRTASRHALDDRIRRTVGRLERRASRMLQDNPAAGDQARTETGVTSRRARISRIRAPCRTHSIRGFYRLAAEPAGAA
jgi:hypothetical protein